ncbi:hypothetical protein Nepgr_029397 [Nepenthes gracilis]|uniref:Uncharacterized protein n=1 Tax=Nepenthes gracilis TaxID=150966 RepID=A0AAD3Y510_NEPGR|nr:hypothetical protein Nepgr_029397 [Nepenthes gracilis]
MMMMLTDELILFGHIAVKFDDLNERIQREKAKGREKMEEIVQVGTAVKYGMCCGGQRAAVDGRGGSTGGSWGDDPLSKPLSLYSPKRARSKILALVSLELVNLM